MTRLETTIMDYERQLGVIEMHRYTPKELKFMKDSELHRIAGALLGYIKDQQSRKAINKKERTTFSCLKIKN